MEGTPEDRAWAEKELDEVIEITWSDDEIKALERRLAERVEDDSI